MINIIDFSNYKSNGRTYGGNSGSKRGILINGNDWFLKYPKSTKSMEVDDMSYTTTPLSEYLGSHIYELLGFDVHETVLGYVNGKIVVACRDFTKNNEILVDYNSLRNNPDMLDDEKIDSLTSDNSLEELEDVMGLNIYFKNIPGLKERFWDMFVVDTFINNNDRNPGNWGIVLNRDTYEYSISPIYDNGASFYNKTSDERMKNILSDEFKMKQSFYDNARLIFTINDKVINPLKLIESMANEELNKAVLRIVPKINLAKIKEMFDEVPREYNGLSVMSQEQKDYYYASLEYKYNNVLLRIYEQLVAIESAYNR